MAPDRPDELGVENSCGLTVTRILNFGDSMLTLKEEEDTLDRSSGAVDVPTDTNSMGAKSPSEPGGSPVAPKLNQNDDDLTSLTWLHQQNLLKGLEIPSPTKSLKEEHINNNNNNINNNNNNTSSVTDDSGDLSENTSISSLDDSYFSENVGKIALRGGKNTDYVNSGQKYEKSSMAPPIFGDSIKFGNTQPSNPAKISLNNNNLPVSNRNKHPTHIPYDPHLHRSSKPPYSFSCLIFMAIEDSPVKALPVKEVYAWILDHFPYFRNAPTGWKNSVRHNLSLNKCFRKVEKAPNLGKGSLWMVDDQYRPNLLQALSRAPFPPPTGQSLSSPEKTPKKNANTRLPDPVLFPYLSKRLASSNISDSQETEFDSDVDAAAFAMLSFKHGPIILNHNKDRKRKLGEAEKLVPVITRSSCEDHTYSCITSVKPESKRSGNCVEETATDVDEQRKIAEGADALLNLAGVTSNHNSTNCCRPQAERSPDYSSTSPVSKVSPSKSKRRTTSSDFSNLPDKRRRRWREWGDSNRYLKQVRG